MPTDLADAIAVSLRVAAVFESLGISYLVGGSIASSLHGIPRATEDVDVVALIAGRQVPALVAALGEEFYADADTILDAILHRSEFNLIHLPTVTKVDVFVPGHGSTFAAQRARAQRQAVAPDGDGTLVVASPEDTVAQKLAWYRQGGGVSDRQWRDVLGVLKVQGRRMDRDILREAARTLGVDDLLERALGEASP